MDSTSGPSWQTAGYPIPATTADEFSEFAVTSTLGVVSGVYATSLGFARGLTASLSSLARGEVANMTEQLAEARHHAIVRCIDQAMRIGGNGVVAVRFDSNEVGNGGIIEIHCYGTAVVIGGRGA